MPPPKAPAVKGNDLGDDVAELLGAVAGDSRASAAGLASADARSQPQRGAEDGGLLSQPEDSPRANLPWEGPTSLRAGERRFDGLNPQPPEMGLWIGGKVFEAQGERSLGDKVAAWRARHDDQPPSVVFGLPRRIIQGAYRHVRFLPLGLDLVGLIVRRPGRLLTLPRQRRSNPWHQ